MTLRRLLLAGILTFCATVIVLGGRDAPQPAATTAGTQNGNASLFNESLVRAFTYRNVGPFRMQARASAIAVPASPEREHRYTFYLATWTGGIFKTTNACSSRSTGEGRG